MARLKVVLFDLDETLVPEMKPEREALLIACGLVHRKYGIDPERVAETVGEAARKLWAQWSTPDLYSSIAYSGWEGLWGPPDLPDDGLGNDQETVDQYKREAWDEVLLVHGIHDAKLRDLVIERHRIERVRRLKPYPGIAGLLERVGAEYRLGVVTNGSPAVQRFKLERSGLTDYFEAIVASGDVGVGKPNPKPFMAALDALDVDPEEAVMIGDSWRSDIQGAAGVRMPTIWFNPDRLERPAGGVPPTVEINSLREIPEAIRQIVGVG